jgi:hypothetical protein
MDVPAGQGRHKLVGPVVGVDRRTDDMGCHPVQGEVQQGAVTHRAQGLGPYVGQRPEPGAGSCGQHHADQPVSRHPATLSRRESQAPTATLWTACQP